MKKILFILIFFVVNSFALNLIFEYGDSEWCVGEVSRGTSVYEDNTNFYGYKWTNSNGHNTPYTLDEALVPGNWWVSVGSYKHSVLSSVVQIDCSSGEPICPDGQSWDSDSSSCVSSAPTCSDNQHLENNVCVCDPGFVDDNGTCIDACPGVNNYLVSDGSCTNCNNDDYLQDAQCNCQAVNSQLDLKPYLGFFVTIDNIQYTQYTATCLNGASFQILVKNLEIVDNNDSNVSDINDSVPGIDYNTTSNNDYNATGIITDENSTTVQNTNYLGQKLDNIGSLTSGLGQKLDNIGSIASNSNSKLASIDNSLKSISSKNDLINSNLQSLKAVNQNGFNDIGKKIDDVKKEISGDNFTGDLSFGGITDFYNNLQTDIDTISSNYDYYSSIYENGFSTDDFQISSGVNPDFQTTVFGKTFDLDLCPIFSTFKPIMYLIFSFVFLFLAVRITWLGIKFNQGSN